MFASDAPRPKREFKPRENTKKEYKPREDKPKKEYKPKEDKPKREYKPKEDKPKEDKPKKDFKPKENKPVSKPHDDIVIEVVKKDEKPKSTVNKVIIDL